MKTYVFFGGTLEGFITFRQSWITSILAEDPDAQVINIYWGNLDRMSPPKIDAARCHWINLGGNHAGALVFDIKPLIKLALTLRKYAPDAIVAFNAKPILFTSLLKRLGIVKTHAIALLEGLGFGFAFLLRGRRTGFKSSLKTRLVRFATRSLDKWIFLNTHDHTVFTDNALMGPGARHYISNGIGVDLDYYKNAAGIDDNWNKQAVGFAGRLIQEKGVHIVAAVAKAVHAKMPDVQFYIAGRKTPHASNILNQDIDTWLKSGTFKSIQYYPDNRAFYNKLSLVMLPTVYNEGLPAVAMEGQAMGLPVLINDIPQTKSAVDDGVTGHLVQNNDITAYAEHIINLLSDQKHYRKMAGQCRHFAEDEFDRAKVNAAYNRYIGS